MYTDETKCACYSDEMRAGAYERSMLKRTKNNGICHRGIQHSIDYCIDTFHTQFARFAQRQENQKANKWRVRVKSNSGSNNRNNQRGRKHLTEAPVPTKYFPLGDRRLFAQFKNIFTEFLFSAKECDACRWFQSFTSKHLEPFTFTVGHGTLLFLECCLQWHPTQAIHLIFIDSC